jgi:dihydroorotate dehydrogenase
LASLSTDTIARLAQTLDGSLPIIGVGGILSGPDAREKFQAGASLVQLYTGLIYQGPVLIRRILEDLAASLATSPSGFANGTAVHSSDRD